MRSAVFAVVVSLSLVGCAKVNPALVAADDVVTERLTSASQEIRKRCEAPALAAPCADIRPVLSDALGVAIEFNRAVAAQKPFELGKLLVSIGKVTEKVLALPQGETAKIIADLSGAISAARTAGGVQ